MGSRVSLNLWSALFIGSEFTLELPRCDFYSLWSITCMSWILADLKSRNSKQAMKQPDAHSETLHKAQELEAPGKAEESMM